MALLSVIQGAAIVHFCEVLLYVLVGGQEGVVRLFPTNEAAGDGLGEGPVGVIGLDVPVHCAAEAFFLDVIRLKAHGGFVIVGDHHGAGGIHQVRDLGNIVPADAVAVVLDFVEVHLFITVVAEEGDAQDDLVHRDTGVYVQGHRLVAAALGHGRRVKSGVVVRRLAHVVGHDVHEVHVLDAVLEVDVLCAGR